MKILIRIYSSLFKFLEEIYFLLRSYLPAKKKWIVFKTYLKIIIKHKLSGYFKFNNESFYGYNISFFDYDSFKFLFTEIFIKNEYFFKTDKKRPVIFDCGSNIGMSVVYFKWLYPESEIYAFEPDRETFKILKANIEKNKFNNVYLNEIALANKVGKVNLYIDNENPGNLTMSIIKNRLPLNEIKVNSSKLSSFIKSKKIDLIKMDIEGAESEVIKDLVSAKKLNQVNELILEYHHLIGDDSANFSNLLFMLEKNDFKYRIKADTMLLYQKFVFQDILVYAYKSKTNGGNN